LIVFLFVGISYVPSTNSISLEGEFETQLVIEGPTEVVEGQYLEYLFYLIEPGDYDIWVLTVDWGDLDEVRWFGPFNSSHVFHLFHDWWKGAGVYTIKAVMFTEYKEFPANLTVTVTENSPPDDPKVRGPTIILKPGSYEYKFKALDPEGEMYLIKLIGQMANLATGLIFMSPAKK